MKKHEAVTDNPPIRINVNKITFRIKAAYYLESLMPGRMKLLRSTKNKITKGENG